ncbi:fibroblast growth factor-binding protein 1-like [Plectropomus leopardus]|uniref:fibroblast growth factor-binding protein 1-like n=1 Tax=Plectropomus leopardus TaxID=160734 RepID=UPI001C4B93C2|nr:fibroblast growth factor-binding protein 1-like [Plectropomus leopardus]
MKAMCEATESHKKQLYAQQHKSFSIINCPLKEEMLLLKTFAPWLLLAFLGQQVSLSSAARNKNRDRDRTVTTAAPDRAQRSGDKPAAKARGKFSKNKMQCTWGAKDVGDTVRLTVKCEDPVARVKGGVTDLQCLYNGKPQSCPGYRSNNKGFWKQVGRALKRLQDKACEDERALVKASMCKRAPRDAHFKLDVFSSVASAQSGGIDNTPPPPPPPRANTTACTRRADHRKTAEENCSDSWVSVCSFFLSLLQSDDC